VARYIGPTGPLLLRRAEVAFALGGNKGRHCERECQHQNRQIHVVPHSLIAYRRESIPGTLRRIARNNGARWRLVPFPSDPIASRVRRTTHIYTTLGGGLTRVRRARNKISEGAFGAAIIAQTVLRRGRDQLFATTE